MVNREASEDSVSAAKLRALRKEYAEAELLETGCELDPMRQLERWLDEAVAAKLEEPNAMILSTVNADGAPSARAVLLKEVHAGKLIFYTNYNSRKSVEIAHNPAVAGVFLWAELERQVRIEGVVKKITREKSEQYFRTRPRESQLAAVASDQSKVVESRAELDQHFEKVSKAHQGEEVPCPEYWGGFALNPRRVEFWQGRENRLHDRLCYTRSGNSDWKRERLSP